MTIRGRDDAGRAAPLGEVGLTLPAHGARRLSAQQLESGAASLSGRLGAGEGKWQLSVSAGRAIEVVSLLQSPTGHLSNLSTTPGGASPSTGDGNDSIAEAVDVAVGATVSGRIDSVGDVDYFRIDVTHTGTLVVWTSGEVATDLELLDADGNPLASAVRPSAARAPGASARVTAKATTLAPNFNVKEYEVLRGKRYILRVGHKIGVGGFTLKNDIVQPGVTGVHRDYPVPTNLSFTVGKTLSYDVAPHFDTEGRAGITFSATVENPARTAVNVGVTFSGSVMTLVGAESGPAFSDTLTITVRASALGVFFAELEIPVEFTREESSGNRRVTIERFELPASNCIGRVDIGGQSYQIPKRGRNVFAM